MSEKREKTKFVGVYQRKSELRRNPRDGKADACFYISYKNQMGKKIWEKIGWKSEGYTAAVANEARADRLQSVRHGEVITKIPEPAKMMTFGQAWAVFDEKWLPTLARAQDERGRYIRHIADIFSDLPLDGINTLMLEDFKRSLAQKGLAPASIKLILGDIRRVYKKMTDWGLYSGRIPTDSLKMPKVDNARIRYLTPEEAERLLTSLKLRSHTWWRIAAISLYTGMRLGEVLALKASDIDLRADVIHVRYAKNKTRMAQINADLKPLFEDIINRRPTGYLFANNAGQRMRSQDASKTYTRVVHDLGLNADIEDSRQKAVFHTLRHTFCSWLAIKGVPLYTIAELVGHSTLEMTKRYSHLCPDAKKQAISLISDMAKDHGGSGTALQPPPTTILKVIRRNPDAKTKKSSRKTKDRVPLS